MDDRPPRTTIDPERLAIMQVVVMLLVAFASSSAYLTRYCLAVANEQIQTELSISPKEMGWVLGAWNIGYLLLQIPGGWIGTRFGTRGAFAGISALWSLVTIWTSMAASYLPMLLSRAVFGGAQAGLVPLSATVIKDWMPIGLRGSCSAAVSAAMSVGGVAAMWLTARLMGYFENDWRWVFQIYSLVGIGWAILFFAIFRTRPEQHPWLNASARPVSETIPDFEAADAAAAIAADSATPMAELTQRMLASRTMWAICVQSIFRGAGYSLLVSWMPYYLKNALNVETIQSANLTVYPLIGVVCGSLSGGAAVDLILRLTGSKRLSRTGIAIAVLTLCALFMVLGTRATTSNGFVVMMSVAAFCFGISSPATWAATLDIAGRDTSVVMGTMNMAGCIGAWALPTGVGYLIDSIEKSGGDWNSVIYVTAAVNFAAAIAWLFVNPNDRTIIGDEISQHVI